MLDPKPDVEAQRSAPGMGELAVKQSMYLIEKNFRYMFCNTMEFLENRCDVTDGVRVMMQVAPVWTSSSSSMNLEWGDQK